MWGKIIRVVNARQMRMIRNWFIASAVLQGITLSLLIPFLRAFLGAAPDLGMWTALVVGAGLCALVVDTVAMFVSFRVSVYDVCDSMIDRIASRVLALPLGWFDAKREAQVASATSREVNTISHVVSIVLPRLTNAFVVPAVMMVATAFYDWRLAAIMAAAVPPLWWVLRLTGSATERANTTESVAATAAAGRLIEFSRLQTVLRATGATKRGWTVLDDALEAESSAVLSSLVVRSRPAQGFSLIITLTYAALVTAGMALVMGGELDPVVYLALMAVCARISGPIGEAALIATEANNAGVAFDRVLDILESRPLPEPDPFQARTPSGASVAFDHVSFSYEQGSPVLRDVSFEAEPGAVTAIVGPSGAGKSTVLRLAARFWDAGAGAVRVGGVDVREMTQDTLMRQVAFVFQDTFLFDDTLAENIRLGSPDATMDDVMAAAHAAQAHDFIMALPQGYETRAGERGIWLSGGQRQRITIARAILQDRPILVLDEATAFADPENEALLVQALARLMHGKTVILVAHRLSTIIDADQILVFDRGRLVEHGTHAELLQATEEGVYARLWNSYQAAQRWSLPTPAQTTQEDAP